MKGSTTHPWYVKEMAGQAGGLHSQCRFCCCIPGAGSAVPLGCPIQHLAQSNSLCQRKDLEESEGWDESVLKAAQRGAIPLEVTPPTPCLSFLQAGAELNAARGGGCVPSAPSSVPGF